LKQLSISDKKRELFNLYPKELHTPTSELKCSVYEINGKLITFLSAIENESDAGVEYIYVENGIYDRSKKRNNINEVQKVADLVFEHFKTYRDTSGRLYRSLGVITFNASQADAIYMCIENRRMQKSNSEFEKFFNEDEQEPFFIRSIENVQGNERDTIIISIGYEKDNTGK